MTKEKLLEFLAPLERLNSEMYRLAMDIIDNTDDEKILQQVFDRAKSLYTDLLSSKKEKDLARYEKQINTLKEHKQKEQEERLQEVLPDLSLI